MTDQTNPRSDPVARVLVFRRWRWGALVAYIIALPFVMAHLPPGPFLAVFFLTLIVGAVLFVRLGRHRLDPKHFEGSTSFETLVDALPQTFGTHLYLRERYSRDRGKQTSIKIKKRKSYSGIRSAQPFLILKAAGNRLFLTPRRYWLHTDGRVISGPIEAIDLETFDLEEKVVRPREDDQVLGSTWRYATKSGDRDLRFNDNHELWLVRRHAVELAIGKYRWAICLYGLNNARAFVSTFAEIANKPIEVEYHPQDEDEEQFAEEPPPIPPRWFDILGVSPQATVGEIKTAYRDLLKQYHPDRAAGLGEKLRRVANEEAGELIRAYKEGIAERGQG